MVVLAWVGGGGRNLRGLEYQGGHVRFASFAMPRQVPTCLVRLGYNPMGVLKFRGDLDSPW